ncbi:hypothetical protein DM01DRAFT_83607 [Hesseltinella vesiculosa]|uniref:Uncharacterized protein n=1 Tax=Hesseltinella vesiculosa TaxID=101127 RepID=A0A1X2G6M7_9FUNG|nr:hypothetical protein DM01DRAFT_83607 [Hesseltinella vesiculosa]
MHAPSGASHPTTIAFLAGSSSASAHAIYTWGKDVTNNDFWDNYAIALLQHHIDRQHSQEFIYQIAWGSPGEKGW